MNKVEFNSILFYADYLSLKDTSTPVTNPCKYFFVHGVPMNMAYIAQVLPEVDLNNKYVKQSSSEYFLLKDTFGEDGAQSFINSLGEIQSSGMADGERLLRQIHQYSTRDQRGCALAKYRNFLRSKTYTHTTINENGDPQETECKKYVYDAERVLKLKGIFKSIRQNDTDREKLDQEQ